MEASHYFSTLVLAMCALHLVWSASVKLGSRWQKHAPLSKRQVKRAVQRSDWYAFFYCSDLVGKDPVSKKTAAGRKVQDQTYRISRIGAY